MISTRKVLTDDVVCHAGDDHCTADGTDSWRLGAGVALSWHYIFWILAVAAILASAMIFFLIKKALPPERRQPFHIRTTIGNFAALFRHKRVLSYMLASGFRLCRDVLILKRRTVCLH